MGSGVRSRIARPLAYGRGSVRAATVRERVQEFARVSPDRLLTRAAPIGAATVRERSSWNTIPYIRNAVLSLLALTAISAPPPSGLAQLVRGARESTP